MTDQIFVYITMKQEEGKTEYLARSRWDIEAYLSDINRAKELGFSLFRSYRVNEEQFNPVLSLCEDFSKGRLNLDGLDTKVKEIIGGKDVN